MSGDGVENKLQTIEAQFSVLDSSMQKLSQKFEFWSMALENQIDQYEMWASLLENRLTSVEINLLYSYICETIHYLHFQVIEKLPELAGTLPSLSSVLKKKSKNLRIRMAWESVLDMLELQEEDVKALCTFFIRHANVACYYPSHERQNYTSDINTIITKAVSNQLFQQILLRAVHVVENRKA